MSSKNDKYHRCQLSPCENPINFKIRCQFLSWSPGFARFVLPVSVSLSFKFVVKQCYWSRPRVVKLRFYSFFVCVSFSVISALCQIFFLILNYKNTCDIVRPGVTVCVSNFYFFKIILASMYFWVGPVTYFFFSSKNILGVWY